MELKVKRKGWVIMIDTLFQGPVIGDWSEDGPYIFETEKEAWKEIADSMIICLQQFIAGERELEHTDFGTEEYVEEYTEWEDGTIQIGDNRQTTTLEQLIKQR